MKKEFIDTGIDVKLHVGAGDPAELILSVADEDNVSLIAMSAFGLDWIRELVLGSTTFTVVRKTKKTGSHYPGRTGKQNPAERISGLEVHPWLGLFHQADALNAHSIFQPFTSIGINECLRQRYFF